MFTKNNILLYFLHINEAIEHFFKQIKADIYFKENRYTIASIVSELLYISSEFSPTPRQNFHTKRFFKNLAVIWLLKTLNFRFLCKSNIWVFVYVYINLKWISAGLPKHRVKVN